MCIRTEIYMSLFFGKTIFKTIIFKMEFCLLQKRTTKTMIYCYPSIIIIIITMTTLKGFTSNTEMKLLEIGYFKLQCVSVNTSHSTFRSNKSKTHLHSSYFEILEIIYFNIIYLLLIWCCSQHWIIIIQNLQNSAKKEKMA